MYIVYVAINKRDIAGMEDSRIKYDEPIRF